MKRITLHIDPAVLDKLPEYESKIRQHIMDAVLKASCVPAELWEERPPYQTGELARANVRAAYEAFETQALIEREWHLAQWERWFEQFMIREQRRTRAVDYLMWRLRGRRN